MRLGACLLVLAAGAAAAVAAPGDDEVQRARELYATAEGEVAAGQYEDAVRDYRGSYELTKDAALLFKIGSAYEKAGKCADAVEWYRRYLATQPPASFVARAEARIAVCAPPAGTGSGSAGPGEAGSAAGSGSDATTAGSGSAGSGSAAPLPVRMSNHRRGAWLLASGAAGLATIGAVLAYSASSSENDIRDLYIGTGGRPPVFDATTRKRYDDLVAQGRRYEHLSWASFGVAGTLAAGAAVLFVWHGDSRVEPIVGPAGGGVRVRF